MCLRCRCLCLCLSPLFPSYLLFLVRSFLSASCLPALPHRSFLHSSQSPYLTGLCRSRTGASPLQAPLFFALSPFLFPPLSPNPCHPPHLPTHTPTYYHQASTGHRPSSFLSLSLFPSSLLSLIHDPSTPVAAWALATRACHPGPSCALSRSSTHISLSHPVSPPILSSTLAAVVLVALSSLSPALSSLAHSLPFCPRTFLLPFLYLSYLPCLPYSHLPPSSGFPSATRIATLYLLLASPPSLFSCSFPSSVSLFFCSFPLSSPLLFSLSLHCVCARRFLSSSSIFSLYLFLICRVSSRFFDLSCGFVTDPLFDS